MSIKFNKISNEFIIETKLSKYIFTLVDNKYLIHEFYGKKETDVDYSIKNKIISLSPSIETNDFGTFSLNDVPLEFSFFGSGDFRSSSLRIKSQNGDSVTSFIYKSYEIIKGRVNLSNLPFSRANDNTETLIITLFDEITNCELKLYYTVFEEYDIISRYFNLENLSDKSVKIEKAMSICLDLPEHNYDVISLYGSHTNERNIQRSSLNYGNFSITSRRGASSHFFNPFIAIVDADADETSGNVYGFNLVYSGSFLDEIEVNYPGNTRVGIGLGSENFSYTVSSNEKFFSPEALMVYADSGIGDMSRKWHKFIIDNILPPEKSTKRPIVLNTWEAFYFDIDRNTIVDIAKEGAKYGIDMLVVDDGWFGKRYNDKAGLGDWYVNKEKFPNGIIDLSDKVRQAGMKFGIWIEPEMVNPDSDLYRNHPDWCLVAKNRKPTLSRNQLVLDFCNPEVIEYIEKSLAETFKDAKIDYIKWDFNRFLTEVGSLYLPSNMQDEAFFRYQLGVYKLYSWFKENFPETFLENCSSGGGRYDLAMMTYSSQIWTSDNTNATDRVKIQYGSTIAYPALTMSCHVSKPIDDNNILNHFDYKYKVAIGGILGYEFNILNSSEEIKKEIKKQTDFYRTVEPLIKYGLQYRLISPFENKLEISSYYYSNSKKNADKILLSFLQNNGNQEDDKEYCLKIETADKNSLYKDEISGQEYSGEALKSGIIVKASKNSEYGVLWYFVKKK